MLNGIFKFVDNVLIVSNVSCLDFSNVDHPQFFITVFEGHPVFNSIPVIFGFFQNFFSRSNAV
jgi:hypothetical protein